MSVSPGPSAARNILLIGGTGLVGGALLARLQGRVAADSLWLPLRREPPTKTPGWHRLPIEPATAVATLDQLEQRPRFATFISCLGTTRRQAGSAQAFVATDRDLVLAWAELARQRGAQHALLVSSVGADPSSGNLYLRTKGEVEQAIGRMGFRRFDVLRPSLLIGKRSGPARSAEAVGQALSPYLDRLLVGRLRRYRSIRAEHLAAAVHALIDQAEPGQYIHHHPQLTEWAGRSDS